MHHLNFDNNWRRVLLMTKITSRDVDEPTEYVILNDSKLPMRIGKFCEKHWDEFGFDYDPYSMVLWPLHDSVAASELVEVLNAKYASVAKVVKKIPSEVHGLGFDSGLQSGFDEGNE